jgi:hypothetical protein
VRQMRLFDEGGGVNYNTARLEGGIPTLRLCRFDH